MTKSVPARRRSTTPDVAPWRPLYPATAEAVPGRPIGTVELGSVRSTRAAAPEAVRGRACPRPMGSLRPAPTAGADRPAGTDRRAWAVVLPRPERELASPPVRVNTCAR